MQFNVALYPGSSSQPDGSIPSLVVILRGADIRKDIYLYAPFSAVGDPNLRFNSNAVFAEDEAEDVYGAGAALGVLATAAGTGVQTHTGTGAAVGQTATASGSDAVEDTAIIRRRVFGSRSGWRNMSLR